PVHFRIIKDRKVSYISSSIMLPEALWDFKANKVKPKHPNSARLNSFLSNKFNEIQDQVFEHETVQKSTTARQLRDHTFGKKPTDFFGFAEGVMEEGAKSGKIGTYDKNRSILAKLKEYANGRALTFQDIDLDFLLKYESYLKNHLGNSVNTINMNFKFLRKLFNDAYRQELIEHQVNPFLKYQMKLEKTERTYLAEEELKLIEAFQPTPGTRMELHRDMFVFAAYAGGIRISDLLQMRWAHFDGTNINFKIMKTGTQLSIKVPNKGLEILEKYRPENPTPNAFLFPMLSTSLNMKDAREVDSAISSATAYVNKNLKIIADKLGIEKKISFHISRHTWATRALRKGISIDKVSKIMGHAAIRETQIYAKIVSSELDKAM
ncbi:MAG TPA: site-specific integrase, partial [Catalimonadaceae bacterium]|nr:site-specific integrase [Catalimonadaceae bacterium]